MRERGRAHRERVVYNGERVGTKVFVRERGEGTERESSI